MATLSPQTKNPNQTCCECICCSTIIYSTNSLRCAWSIRFSSCGGGRTLEVWRFKSFMRILEMSNSWSPNLWKENFKQYNSILSRKESTAKKNKIHGLKEKKKVALYGVPKKQFIYCMSRTLFFVFFLKSRVYVKKPTTIHALIKEIEGCVNEIHIQYMASSVPIDWLKMLNRLILFLTKVVVYHWFLLSY